MAAVLLAAVPFVAGPFLRVSVDALDSVEAGAFAVHIPYVITWAHELADAPEGHDRYGALERIAELPAWIAARADG